MLYFGDPFYVVRTMYILLKLVLFKDGLHESNCYNGIVLNHTTHAQH